MESRYSLLDYSSYKLMKEIICYYIQWIKIIIVEKFDKVTILN